MQMRQSIIYSIILLLSLTTVQGQISPGDLARAHAELEGIHNCTKCHVLGDKVTNEKCLDCHKEIAVRIKANKGYHVSSDVKGKACVECHNDHHGLDFDMLNLDEDKFDHAKTGYLLEGAHAREECTACHKQEFIVADDAKKKKSTHLGLDEACLTCHKDYHRETLTDNCLDCHNYEKFAPAPGFDHNKTDFVLKGKHQKVECLDCHKKEVVGGEPFQHFANVEHQNCTACHDDVHHNKFGQNCTQCHNEVSFRNVKGLDNFDHSKTGYPLEGMHVNVDCKECHKTNYTNPVKHKRCTDCHDDYHEGEFAVNGKSPDCETCHKVDGFTRTNYTIEKHNESAFILEGAHMATPCFSCHKKEDKWQFKKIGSNCIDCHENTHQGYMDKKYTDDGCDACHNVNAWSELTFDHEKTGFSLLGEHAKTDCRSCHYRVDEKGVTAQKFSDLTEACLQCHNDEHLGQFAKYGDTGCEKCHGYDNWKAEKFSHDNSRFKLEGAHATVDCIDCHTQERMSGGRCVKYIYEDIKCATCHK